MIVFTITNDITQQVFVGTTKDSVDERWKQLQSAAEEDYKAAAFFKDIRDFGARNFTASEYAVAYDRQDLKDLFEEAMDEHQGTSLVGIKTVKPKPVAAPSKKKTVAAKTAASKTKAASKVTTKRSTPKIASGRTTNAAKERAIKEAIAEEKAQRDSLKSTQAIAEAAEMRAIMAKLDAKGSTLKKR